MDLWLERPVFPDHPVSPEVTFDFHVDTFARWLRSAGAEARLAIAFVSGPAARQALERGLAARGCRPVTATARPGTPVHPTLAAHQGDHFNDTLFVVDGLECEDAARGLREIGTQIAQFRRLATWVVVLIESPAALAALESAGGILRRHAARRFVVLSGEDAFPLEDPVSADAVSRWRREHRVAERIYHLARTPGTAPDLLDFGRLLRAGWGGLRVHPDAHATGTQLRKAWMERPRDAGALMQLLASPDPELSLGIGRLCPWSLEPGAPRAALAMNLAPSPEARYMSGLPVSGEGPLAALAEARSTLDDGRLPSFQVLSTLRAAAEDGVFSAHLRMHVRLALAQAAVVAEALETCREELMAADRLITTEGLALAPELVFEVVERRTALDAAAGERADARLGLDRLADLLPRLGSPFYAARHVLARGEQMMALDPGRGREALREAGTLFSAHGYARWAALAREAAG
ncbi:hypothetical protein L6V77_13630 [Myxococcota bacterium]|nr:hypothetical protein [Myxococcota bacterium]